MAKRFGLPRAERLKSRKQIDELFAGKKGFAVFPIRVMYRFAPANEPPRLQVGVSVSKRHFKKAVERNRIKRLLREAYRLQKEALHQQMTNTGKRGSIFFLYTDKTIAPFEVIKSAVAKCLKKLSTIASSENVS